MPCSMVAPPAKGLAFQRDLTFHPRRHCFVMVLDSGRNLVRRPRRRYFVGISPARLGLAVAVTHSPNSPTWAHMGRESIFLSFPICLKRAIHRFILQPFIWKIENCSLSSILVSFCVLVPYRSGFLSGWKIRLYKTWEAFPSFHSP